MLNVIITDTNHQDLTLAASVGDESFATHLGGVYRSMDMCCWSNLRGRRDVVGWIVSGLVVRLKSMYATRRSKKLSKIIVS